MLTIIDAADSYDLVSLAGAKAALNVTGSSEDAKIAAWIEQASAAISTYCGRVFAVETVRETIRHNIMTTSLVLARFPIVEVHSVVEGTTTLTDDDYEVDAASGIVDRLFGKRSACWSPEAISIEYEAGFTSIPADLQRACIVFLTHIQSNAGRDMTLRSSATTDILSESWFEPSSDALPPEVASLAEPYRARNSR